MSTRIAIMHYSAPPRVGGVEEVIYAQASFLCQAGFDVTVMAGSGHRDAFPQGVKFELVPEMDSRREEIVNISKELESGKVPPHFGALTDRLKAIIASRIEGFDNVIIHNIVTKHFNLPLTAALFHLIEQKKVSGPIAWCHDVSWTSAHSQSKVHPGFPWDYLRDNWPGVTYVTVSRSRQVELAGLLQVPAENIRVIYNGVDPANLYALTPSGLDLIHRLGLWDCDLILLMPVRITQAKNIEYAIEVTKALKERGIAPTLVITGPPDPHDPSVTAYFVDLKQHSKTSHVESNVRFVYESGPEEGQPFEIDRTLLSQLFRVSDVLFLPSHREGFGMPVLEAGLVGLPVVSSMVPAAIEIGKGEIFQIGLDGPAEKTAALIMDKIVSSPVHGLRLRVRRQFTWQAIMQRELIPLLKQNEVT